MRRAIAVMVSALACAGCNELIDVGRFTTGDAAVERDGGMDGGPRDGGGVDSGGVDGGGVDSCALREWYADVDGDGHGDAASIMTGCAPPTGHVASAGDCDDGDPARYPGAAETCDAIDQDCDGAIDEGHIGPVGAPILIESSYGFADGVGASVVAHAGGVTVVWRNDDSPMIFASFYDRAGVAHATGVVIDGSTSSPSFSPHAIRVTNDGLDQVFIAWTEASGIYAKLCSTDGADCGFSRQLVAVDRTLVDDLGLFAVEDRVIVHWTQSDGLHVLSHALRTGADSSVVIPPLTGVDTDFGGVAYVGGASPHLLFTRIRDNVLGEQDGGVTLDGGVMYHAPSEVVRVRGLATLAFDESTDVFPWSMPGACVELGVAHCVSGLLGLAGAEGVLDRPSLFGVDVTSGVDVLDGGTPMFRICGAAATPREGAIPELGECYEVETLGFFFAMRGAVATTAIFTGTGYAIRELPVFEGTEGRDRVLVPAIDLLLPGQADVISMHENHGALIGNADTPSGFDVTLIRLGCTP